MEASIVDELKKELEGVNVNLPGSRYLFKRVAIIKEYLDTNCPKWHSAFREEFAFWDADKERKNIFHNCIAGRQTNHKLTYELEEFAGKVLANQVAIAA